MTADRYWEARWRDEKAHNDVLIEALMMARRRIEYLGIVCADPRHFDANDKLYFPKIDAALEFSPAVGKGEA
jgi:hypothetical protein